LVSYFDKKVKTASTSSKNAYFVTHAVVYHVVLRVDTHYSFAGIYKAIVQSVFQFFAHSKTIVWRSAQWFAGLKGEKTEKG
jgi:hypothetical protein